MSDQLRRRCCYRTETLLREERQDSRRSYCFNSLPSLPKRRQQSTWRTAALEKGGDAVCSHRQSSIGLANGQFHLRDGERRAVAEKQSRVVRIIDKGAEILHKHRVR